MKSTKIVGSVSCWENIKPVTSVCMNALSATGRVRTWIHGMGSLLPMGRNGNAQIAFANLGDWTHMLFIDADMGHITPELIDALVVADKPVISPICTIRKAPFHPAVSVDDQLAIAKALELPEGKRPIIPCNGLGLACTLIKREVLEKTAELTPSGPVWFTCDRQPRLSIIDEFNKLLEQQDGKTPEECAKAFFQLGLTAHWNTNVIGEDIGFCHRVKRAGFDVFIHTEYSISHVGDQEYNLGDWINHLEKKPEEKRVGDRIIVTDL